MLDEGHTAWNLMHTQSDTMFGKIYHDMVRSHSWGMLLQAGCLIYLHHSPSGQNKWLLSISGYVLVVLFTPKTLVDNVLHSVEGLLNLGELMDQAMRMNVPLAWEAHFNAELVVLSPRQML